MKRETLSWFQIGCQLDLKWQWVAMCVNFEHVARVLTVLLDLQQLLLLSKVGIVLNYQPNYHAHYI